MVVTHSGGSLVEAELAVADAHPLGRRPFGREQFVEKLGWLAEGRVDPAEIDRFVAAASGVAQLEPEALVGLTVEAEASLSSGAAGLFEA
jgi:2-methylcitrate dehydratase